MAISSKIEEIKIPLFTGILFIWHLLYFLVFFGIAYINSSYIRYLSIIIQGFISIFLIMRFHPFRKYAISKFDATVIFSSAIFLFTNLLTTELLTPYLPAIDNYMKGIVKKLLGSHKTSSPTNT
jgi:hypothetical protein